MNASRNQVKSLFLNALENIHPDRWESYLDEACEGNPELRSRVWALLDAHQKADSFVQEAAPTLAIDPAAAPSSEDLDTLIGPYKLIEQIGEGGMGVVYMAEQTQPVKRKVALKIIKPGMDSKNVIARFEAERQALALMDHPNIAKVHDAGTIDSGLPFFVMELVRGIPITQYCDREQLSIRDRLELFVLVCRAVQHAHQKGIIHRDIKPSNVLVTLHDGVPVPKIIDFGVAKAIGQSLTDKTLHTGFLQMIGTPLYMSPEQADVSGVDVDTRSDVYALGVLLYELLTGTTPFDRETFRTAALDEMRRMIREDEPPKPSTRLSTLGAAMTTTSEKRSSDPRHLDQSVRGELDWVVMKCLEKDRQRRYETANGLAADVMRYLTDQPVVAFPPSARYRLGKSVRRNRVALTTAALVAGALIAGTTVSVWQASRATSAAAEAVQKAEESRQVIDYLATDIFGAIAEGKEGGQSLTVGELLDQADATVSERFRGQPLVEASVRLMLARAYDLRGDQDRAVGHATRAAELRVRHLGPNHPATLEALHEQATRLCFRGWNDNSNLGTARLAEAVARRVVAARRRVLGPAHPDTILSQSILAFSISHQGRQREAAEWAGQALQLALRALPPDHNSTQEAQCALAWAVFRSGDLARAELLFRQLLASRERSQGHLGSGTINALKDLAETVRLEGQTDEARRLLQETIERFGQKLGISSVLVSYNLGMLKDVLLAEGDFATMRDLWQGWIREVLATPLETNPYLRSRRSVRLSYLAMDLMSLPESIPFDADLLVRATEEAVNLDGDWDDVWTCLAVVYYRLGRLDDAMQAIETSMARPKWKGGHGFDRLVRTLIHAHRGEMAQAHSWYDMALIREDEHHFNDGRLKPLLEEAEALLGDD